MILGQKELESLFRAKKEIEDFETTETKFKKVLFSVRPRYDFDFSLIKSKSTQNQVAIQIFPDIKEDLSRLIRAERGLTLTDVLGHLKYDRTKWFSEIRDWLEEEGYGSTFVPQVCVLELGMAPYETEIIVLDLNEFLDSDMLTKPLNMKLRKISPTTADAYCFILQEACVEPLPIPDAAPTLSLRGMEMIMKEILPSAGSHYIHGIFSNIVGQDIETETRGMIMGSLGSSKQTQVTELIKNTLYENPTIPFSNAGIICETNPYKYALLRQELKSNARMLKTLSGNFQLANLKSPYEFDFLCDVSRPENDITIRKSGKNSPLASFDFIRSLLSYNRRDKYIDMNNEHLRRATAKIYSFINKFPQEDKREVGYLKLYGMNQAQMRIAKLASFYLAFSPEDIERYAVDMEERNLNEIMHISNLDRFKQRIDDGRINLTELKKYYRLAQVMSELKREERVKEVIISKLREYEGEKAEKIFEEAHMKGIIIESGGYFYSDDEPNI